jgi:hypothetical protein
MTQPKGALSVHAKAHQNMTRVLERILKWCQAPMVQPEPSHRTREVMPDGTIVITVRRKRAQDE